MKPDSHTSLSMLDGMRKQAPEQWERFARVYSPLVREWCRRAAIDPVDTSDVQQEVFRAVAVKIADFRRDKAGDSFHGWLWGITRFKIIDHFRKLAKQPKSTGGSSARQRLNQLPDTLPETWDDASQRSDAITIYNQILGLIKTDFQPHTWQAFWKTAVEQSPAGEVAAELGMTVGAVYNARHKVLRRVRDEFGGVFETPGDLV